MIPAIAFIALGLSLMVAVGLSADDKAGLLATTNVLLFSVICCIVWIGGVIGEKRHALTDVLQKATKRKPKHPADK